jgi:uncharacterized protein YbbK (DUF523 family)
MGEGKDVLLGRAKVKAADGTDVTEAFLEGAKAALRIAERHGAKKAILKGKSPSCGKGCIYDGSFSEKLRQGDGVTAALLKRNGIEVETR